MSGPAPRTGVLLMAHGTPASLDGLEAFYTEIRRGRPPSAEQLADLRRRYEAIGGTSPLTERTAAQAAGVAAALERAWPGRYTVALGAKFAEPRLEAAVAGLAAAGVRRAVGVVLAPHSSVVSVGDYTARAGRAAEAAGLELSVVDHWHDAPGFAELVGARVRRSLAALGPDPATVVFTAHSVPVSVVAGGDDYPEQVAASAAAAAAVARLAEWRVAWQSAGRTPEPWVGPDILDVVDELGAAGVPACLVCPIGFVSDHLEILYDLDIEAQRRAGAAGVRLARTPSFNDDPAFCALVAAVAAAAAGGRR